MEKIKTQLIQFVQLLSNLFKALFGEVNYQGPNWFKKIALALKSFKNSKPSAWLGIKRAVLGLVGLGMVLAGSYYAYDHFRIQPEFVKFSLALPTLTSIEKPKPEVLTLSFTHPVARVEMVGKEETTIVSLSPKLSGKWIWINDKQLQFLPEATKTNPWGWTIGQNFKVSVNDRFFPKGLELKEDQVEFKIDNIKVSAYDRELYRDPMAPKIQRGVTTFRFTYPMDVEDVRRRISASLEEAQSKIPTRQTIAVNTTFNEWNTEVYVTTENIPVPATDSKITIKLEKGSLGAWGGEADEKSVEMAMPGRNSLKILNVQIQNVRNENFEPEQALVLESSLPINGKKLTDHIEVYLLPKRKKNRQWTSATELEQKTMTESEVIKPELHPTETEESRSQSFKVKIPQNRQLLIVVKKGLTNAAEYFMPFEHQQIVSVGEAPKEILIMGAGSLLSISGDKKIPLLSRNISEIKIEMNRILPDQISQVSRQALVNGTFLKPYFSSHVLWDTTQLIEKIIPVNADSKAKSDETQYSTLNLEHVLKPGQKGLFYIQLSENKKKKDVSEYEYDYYDGGSARDQRLILITDLGLVIKKNFSKTYSVFVQNLRTGAPVRGAKVEVLGRNGLSLLDATTNDEGRAEIPNLTTFKREQTPSVFTVTQGEDFVFMPLDHYERQLDYSKFDVGGIYESTDSDQLIGYMFSDRGIYRPGEEINVGYIVRNRLMNKVSHNVPLEMTVTAPDGTQVEKKLIRVNTDDIADFKWQSLDESPTGVYRFTMYVPDPKKGSTLVGEVDVRVEEFAPDELSIFAHYGVDTTQGWLMNPSEFIKLSVKNLFGTAASERVIETRLAVQPIQPYFKKYGSFRFSFNNKNNLGFDQSLPSGKTDTAGEFKQIVDLTKLNEGFYQVRLDTQAMQGGSGRAVYARAVSYFSTVPYLVGFKTESDLSYLKLNSEHQFELIAIDAKLEKTELKKVRMQLSQTKYVSTLLKQPNGLFKYQSIKKDTVLSTDEITIGIVENKLKIPTTDRGDFFYTLTDADNRELIRIDFSVIGDGEEQRGFDKSSELKLTLNKKDFAPESEIEIELRAPFAGSGLITIEREKVYASKWFKSTSPTTVQKIKIPAGVEGYAYVNVSWLRSMDSKQVYMSPLSYAVESFSVSLDSRKNKLEIEVPDLVKPGATLNVSYSASSPTPIILYGVNEGILQVAKYTNPNAIDFFFKRRALQVTTFQLLDLLRPDFSVLKSTSGTGGDMEGTSGDMNLNPFKRKTDPPVVFWSGRIQADAKKKTYSYQVPDYFNGSMRIIAVAANQQMFAQKINQVTVRGDLILSPSVPYFVAPGDEFESAVVVSNQKRGSGEKAEVKVQITSDKLQGVGSTAVSLLIPEGQEKTQIFTLKSKNILGNVDIKFAAELTGAKAERTMSMSVRPPQIFQTTFMTEQVSGEKILKNEREVYSEFAQSSLTLSEMPFTFITAAEVFLANYQYSCSEQLLSRAIGYAALEQLGVTLQIKRDKNKVELKSEITKMIDSLKARQNGDGGLALYPRGTSDEALIPMAFLLNDQLKTMNLTLPNNMTDGLIKNVIDIDFNENSSEFFWRNAARNLYWLSKQGKLVTNKVEFLNRISEKSKDSVLKAYLASSFDNLKMLSEADSLWKKVELHKKPLWSPQDYMSQTSHNAEIIFLAARHNKDKVKAWMSQSDFKENFSDILNGQMQTQSAAWSLLAAVQVLSMNEGKTVFQVSEESNGAYKNIPLAGKMIKRALFNPQTKNLKVTTNDKIYASVVIGGFNKSPSTKEQIKGLEAQRVYLVDGKEATKAKLGEEVTVRIRLKATQGKNISHVVWMDLLPGGLEPKLETISFGESTDVRDGSGVEEPYPQQDEESGEGEGETEGETEGESSAQQPSRSEFFAQLFTIHVAQAQTQNQSQNQPQTQVERYYPMYVDRREDRVVIYGDAGAEIREYTYRAKAASVGKFVIPAFFGENMYDPEVYYKGTEGQFEVYR